MYEEYTPVKDVLRGDYAVIKTTYEQKGAKMPRYSRVVADGISTFADACEKAAAIR